MQKLAPTDKPTNPKLKISQPEKKKGGKHHESRSSLKSRKESPLLLTAFWLLPPDLRSQKFLCKEGNRKPPTPCADQRFDNRSPGCAVRIALLCLQFVAWPYGEQEQHGDRGLQCPLPGVQLCCSSGTAAPCSSALARRSQLEEGPRDADVTHL